MIVVITKVNKEKVSYRDYGKGYIKVEFQNHYKPDETYITYISKENKNYQNWKGFKVGDILGNVELKDKNKNIIDADSKPILVGRELPQQLTINLKESE